MRALRPVPAQSGSFPTPRRFCASPRPCSPGSTPGGPRPNPAWAGRVGPPARRPRRPDAAGRGGCGANRRGRRAARQGGAPPDQRPVRPARPGRAQRRNPAAAALRRRLRGSHPIFDGGLCSHVHPCGRGEAAGPANRRRQRCLEPPSAQTRFRPRHRLRRRRTNRFIELHCMRRKCGHARRMQTVGE